MKTFHLNQIVYYKWKDCFVKYYVKKIVDGLIFVNQYRSKVHNCFEENELLTETEMLSEYDGQKIYE